MSPRFSFPPAPANSRYNLDVPRGTRGLCVINFNGIRLAVVTNCCWDCHSPLFPSTFSPSARTFSRIPHCTPGRAAKQARSKWNTVPLRSFHTSRSNSCQPNPDPTCPYSSRIRLAPPPPFEIINSTPCPSIQYTRNHLTHPPTKSASLEHPFHLSASSIHRNCPFPWSHFCLHFPFPRPRIECKIKKRPLCSRRF